MQLVQVSAVFFGDGSRDRVRRHRPANSGRQSFQRFTLQRWETLNAVPSSGLSGKSRKRQPPVTRLSHSSAPTSTYSGVQRLSTRSSAGPVTAKSVGGRLQVRAGWNSTETKT